MSGIEVASGELVKDKAGAANDSCSGVAPGYVPAEILDLVRFMAKTWAEVDKFVYANCTGDALMQYPVIQGTRNQLDLAKIGEQPINKENLHKAVQWMLST